jgi:rubrerythrin
MIKMLTREQLMKAIEGEQNTIAEYEHIKTLMSDNDQIETMNEIIADEHRHLRDFEELYRRRFGKSMVSPPMVAGCGEVLNNCLRRAVNEELDTAGFYKAHREHPQFFDAMLDEMDHAVRLTMMLIPA